MKAHYEKKFLKDLAKLPKKLRLVVEKFVFQYIDDVMRIEELHNVKKLQGHSEAYRMRFGDYRMGFFFRNGEIFFDHIAHRSEFHRKFP